MESVKLFLNHTMIFPSQKTTDLHGQVFFGIFLGVLSLA